MQKGRKHVFSTLTKNIFILFFSFSVSFLFNIAKGTTVSRVRFTPFPSSRSSLEGARSRGARCSQKKKEKKRKKEEKKRNKFFFEHYIRFLSPPHPTTRSLTVMLVLKIHYPPEEVRSRAGGKQVSAQPVAVDLSRVVPLCPASFRPEQPR